MEAKTLEKTPCEDIQAVAKPPNSLHACLFYVFNVWSTSLLQGSSHKRNVLKRNSGLDLNYHFFNKPLPVVFESFFHLLNVPRVLQKCHCFCLGEHVWKYQTAYLFNRLQFIIFFTAEKYKPTLIWLGKKIL